MAIEGAKVKNTRKGTSTPPNMKSNIPPPPSETVVTYKENVPSK
jgi:hypothetical protein